MRDERVRRLKISVQLMEMERECLLTRLTTTTDDTLEGARIVKGVVPGVVCLIFSFVFHASSLR